MKSNITSKRRLTSLKSWRSRKIVWTIHHYGVAPDVMRHRLVLTYEAEAEEISSDEIVRRVLAGVEVP